MSEQEATWLYAVVPAAGIGPAGAGATGPTGPTGPGGPAGPGVGTGGVAGEPVRLVESAGLAAVVGSVPLAEVAEEPLRRHLRDPAWLARTARRHHRVVTTFARSVPTVPFRLATVYRTDARVRELLARRRERLLAALDTVRARAEWGVQAYAPGGGTAAAERPEPGDTAPGSGTEYLLRARAERIRREQARQRVSAAVREIESTLEPLAVAARSQPHPAAPAGPDRTGQLLLSVSYLVDERDRDRFLERTGRLATGFPELRLRVTGPWPAYSFVEIGAEPQ